MKQLHSRRPQNGFVLVMGLIFLLVIALVGVMTMQNTNISYKLSSNEAFSETAFQGSESGRVAIGESIADYVYYRNWADITTPSQLNILDKDSDTVKDPPTEDNGGSEDLFDMKTLIKDMEYAWNDPNSNGQLKADINIVKTQRIIDPGAGSQQLSGYEGFGKGAAAGGGSLYFEIRSKGFGNSGANAVTAVEYRAKIQ